MKPNKQLVLVAGLLGIIAFFLPFVVVRHQGSVTQVSAYEVVEGLDLVGTARLSGAKTVVIALFVPGALLALIGALGMQRKPFGRVAGTLSLVLGLVTLATGTMMMTVAQRESGIGMFILIVAGGAASAGGLLTLRHPERRRPKGPRLGSLPVTT